MEEKRPSGLGEYAKRTLRLVFGLFLFSLGSFLNIQANIGLAPWEAFTMGLANIAGMSFGNMLVLSGLVILLIDFLLKEKIGFGTILNTILVGKFVDLIKSFNLIPMMDSFLLGLPMLLLGQLVLCLGSFFYIGAALGCGPRDALMVALARRFSRLPVGVVRGLLEGSVLLIGWLMGAKVGLGTVIAVFGIGFILQLTFKILKFDVKNVHHESCLDTIRQFLPGRADLN